MLYIVVVIVLLLITYLITYRCFDYDDEAAASLTFLVGIVLLLVPLLNNCFGIKKMPEYQEQAYTITGLELIGIQENKIEGRFLLGTGYISGRTSEGLKYVFFANTEYGKQMKTTETNNIYLKKTDEEEPKLINIKQKTIRKMNFIDELWGNDNEEEVYSERTVGQILVVPTNTIKINYNVEV